MWPYLLIAGYCSLVALASLAGGTLPSLLRLTHTRMQLIMSFVGGLVLAVALLHLLPHATVETGSVNQAVWAALGGLLTMFFLIRIFHVHQHGPVDPVEEGTCDHDHPHDACPHHDYPLDGDHCATHRHRYSWIGLFVGLALHTLMDGIAIAACVTAEARHPEAAGLLGLGTFLAVLLHKPLDAMSITSVMAAGNWSPKSRQLVNVAFALTNIAGATAFCLGVGHFAEQQHTIVGLALGFSAGVFLCIALADILPEIQFHAHDRLKLSAALVLGVVFAYALGIFESPHQHGNDSQQSSHQHEHGPAEAHSEEDHEH
ncbi:MAG: ZIP family metal transporter [Pirellulaceae bacterium]|nr:ZIP family metal transporter [Pirellulaceae bacterium]